jgi:hypothetical protein
MSEQQHSASAETAQPGGETRTAPRRTGRSAPWGDGLRMIAVTTERLAMANCPTGSTDYLPTVPPDSAERILD